MRESLLNMADEQNEKVEVTKDVLAPIEGPREDLINTAVKFLQNPRVASSPLNQKKAFLAKKGLTQEEIDTAVQRSGILQNDRVSQPPVSQPPIPYNNQQHHNAAVLQYSRWQRVRDIMAVVALASGLTYAAYRFYKQVIHPWWFGLPSAEQRLKAVEKSVLDVQTNVADTLSKIQQLLSVMQEQMGKDQEKLETLSHDLFNRKNKSGMIWGNESLQLSEDSKSIAEIKTDLSTIKGLLLNRRQFPATPVSTPVLPAWQLAAAEGSPSASVLRNSMVLPSGDTNQGQGHIDDALASLNSNDKGLSDSPESSVKITYSEESLTEEESPILNGTGSSFQISESGDAGIQDTNTQNSLKTKGDNDDEVD